MKQNAKCGCGEDLCGYSPMSTPEDYHTGRQLIKGAGETGKGDDKNGRGRPDKG